MIKVAIESVDALVKLHGSYDENIEIIQNELGVTLKYMEGALIIEGTPKSEETAEAVIRKLFDLILKGEPVDKGRVRYCLNLALCGRLNEIDDITNSIVAVTGKGKPIKCKTLGQKKYIDALKKNTVVFAVGPAGTGKTYLAVCHAVSSYKKGEVDKIILTRPAVEAGEKLGFLPGDLQNKVDPYLRPLYDALGEMFGIETYQRLMEKGVIEVAPLAYMRGRTLSSAYVILDEAQNTTKEQMKMFLTRLGEGSKMVVTGDITQIDLPADKTSGLRHAVNILKEIEGIAAITLTHKDVVRHELVQNIVRAYEKASLPNTK